MAKVNKSQQTKKVLLDALEKSLGVVTTACRLAGYDRSLFYRYYNTDKSFAAAVDDVENIALDFTESQLHKEIQKGNITGIIFYLKTKGKKRGYIERSEIVGELTIKTFADLAKEAEKEIDE